MRPTTTALYRLSLVALFACAPTDEPSSDEDTDGAADTDPAEDTDDTTPDDTDDTTPDDTDPGDTDDTDSEDTDATAWSPGAYATEPRSGTRLTAHAIVDAHGNEVVSWFHDTLLDVRCTPQRATDGQLRCLPEGAPVAQFGSGAFADATCQQPALLAPAQCSDTYALVAQTSGTAVYRLGTPIAQLYSIGPRGCGNLGIPADQIAYPQEVVPPSEFVAFTSSHVAVTAELGRRVLTGSDGSKTGQGLWDLTHGQRAVSLSSPSGTLHAVAYEATIDVRDLRAASCANSLPQGYVAAESDTTPAYALVIDATNPLGPPVERLHEVTGTQQTYCQGGLEYAVAPGQTLYLLADTTTDVSTLPELQRRQDSGPGVRLDHWTTADGTPITPTPSHGDGALRRDGVVVNDLAHHDGTRWNLVALDAFYEATDWASGCSNPLVADGTAPTPTLGAPVLRLSDGACQVAQGAAPVVQGAWIVNASSPQSTPLYFRYGQTCDFAGGSILAYPTIPATTDPWTLVGTDL